MFRVGRVVAGVSGSPRSLPALRWARDLAHTHDAGLLLVHAWSPPASALAGFEFPSEYQWHVWEDAAWLRLWHALEVAFGGLPPGIQAEPVVAPGSPGLTLVHAAAGAGDLLVIGAGRRGGVNRLWHPAVSRYCLSHARCPVIAIPPPELELATRYGLATRTLRHKIAPPYQPVNLPFGRIRRPGGTAEQSQAPGPMPPGDTGYR
jgi:nucleotide-binding universal stress UspA family protein